MTSFAFNCVSGSVSRTLTLDASWYRPVGWMPAAFSASSTRARTEASIFSVALALETWTAGASP